LNKGKVNKTEGHLLLHNLELQQNWTPPKPNWKLLDSYYRPTKPREQCPLNFFVPSKIFITHITKTKIPPQKESFLPSKTSKPGYGPAINLCRVRVRKSNCCFIPGKLNPYTPTKQKYLWFYSC